MKILCAFLLLMRVLGSAVAMPEGGEDLSDEVAPSPASPQEAPIDLTYPRLHITLPPKMQAPEPLLQEFAPFKVAHGNYSFGLFPLGHNMYLLTKDIITLLQGILSARFEIGESLEIYVSPTARFTNLLDVGEVTQKYGPYTLLYLTFKELSPDFPSLDIKNITFDTLSRGFMPDLYAFIGEEAALKLQTNEKFRCLFFGFLDAGMSEIKNLNLAPPKSEKNAISSDSAWQLSWQEKDTTHDAVLTYLHTIPGHPSRAVFGGFSPSLERIEFYEMKDLGEDFKIRCGAFSTTIVRIPCVTSSKLGSFYVLLVDLEHIPPASHPSLFWPEVQAHQKMQLLKSKKIHIWKMPVPIQWKDVLDARDFLGAPKAGAYLKMTTLAFHTAVVRSLQKKCPEFAVFFEPSALGGLFFSTQAPFDMFGVLTKAFFLGVDAKEVPTALKDDQLLRAIMQLEFTFPDKKLWKELKELADEARFIGILKEPVDHPFAQVLADNKKKKKKRA